MKCCANCEWSISPEIEDIILKEQGYDEDDINRPKAGDCVWGYSHNGKYVCDHHKYIENGIDTYVLYDDKYLGEGYFIITEYEEQIVKFIKIYKTNYFGLPSYSIRGYEVDSVDTDDRNFREIEISAGRDNVLFDIISNFANGLNKERIYTIDSRNYGKNNLTAEVYKNTAFLVLAKDIWKVRCPSNFIDIELGDHLTCDRYNEVAHLYKSLEEITSNKTKEDTIKRILKISK